MLQAEEVSSMVRLHRSAWSAKRIAQEFGCARYRIRRYFREGGFITYHLRPRVSVLDGLDDWLQSGFFATTASSSTKNRRVTMGSLSACVGGASGTSLAQ